MIAIVESYTLGTCPKIGDHFSSLFLIDSNNGGYQRPGNMLAIAFLVSSIVFTAVRVLSQSYLFIGIMSFLYIGIGVLGMLLSQLIGSNSGMFFILLTLLITLSVHSLLNKKYLTKGTKYFFSVSLKNLFFRSTGWLLLKNTVYKGTLLFIVLFFVINLMGINVASMRFMNFGSDEGILMSSVTSRIELIQDNFIAQLEYSPLLGNMNVDVETTGEGTYAHSLFLSLLTHTGMIGFSLFLLYLLLAYNERQSVLSDFSNIKAGVKEQALRFYLITLFLLVVLMSAMTAFFTWSPLWFTLGACFPPFVFRAYINGEADHV